MFKKIKTISNKLLAIGMVVAVLIVVLIGVDFYQKIQQKQGLAENELLKAPKEKIINYEVKPTKNPDVKGNPESVVVYRYISNKEVPPEIYQGLEEDMSKRTPNSMTFLKSVKPIDEKTQAEEYVAKFYSAPTFQKDGDKWYQVETATTTPSAFFSQTKLTLLDQAKEFFGQKALADQIFSGAGDGYMENYEFDGTALIAWNAVHDGTIANNGLSYTATTMKVGVEYIETGDYEYNFIRAFIPFDTSSIPNSATISAASLSVYVSIKSDDITDNDFITVLQTTQASSTALTTEDYDQCGAVNSPTEGIDTSERKDLGSISTGAYLTFTLNATGLTWIAKSGITSSCGTTPGVTCLGLREGHDVLDIIISIGAVNKQDTMTISSSEALGGTAFDPYLTVTYTTTAGIKIDGGRIKVDGGRIKVN